MENVRKFWRNSVKVQFLKLRSSKQDSKSNNSTCDPNCAIEDENGKNSTMAHSDYLFNVLALEQMHKYLIVTQDVDFLFRNGAHRLHLATETWKSIPQSLQQNTNEENSSLQSSMGIKLIEITSILENLLQRDPVLFYTAGDKQLISQLLTPLNNNMGKLARKTLRLCQQTNEFQKTIFELVERHNPSTDEGVFTMEADESETNSTTDEAIVVKPSMQLSTTTVINDFRKTLDRLWGFIKLCIPSPKMDEKESKQISSSTQLHPLKKLNTISKQFRSKHLSHKNELTGLRTTQASQDIILRIPNRAKIADSAAVINKESLCPPLDSPTINFIVTALTPPTTSITNYNGLNDQPMDDWRKNSYEKVMRDTLGCDSVECFDDLFSDFEQDARTLAIIQKKIDDALNSPCSENSSDIYYDSVISVNRNLHGEKFTANIGDNLATECKNDITSINEEKDIPEKRRMDESGLADAAIMLPSDLCSEENKANESSYQDKERNYIDTNDGEWSKNNLDNQNDNCGRFPLDPMTYYEYSVSEMSSYVNDLINCLRSLENFWLQPQLNSQREGQTKELTELVDHIVFTTNALEDPSFIEQIYVEDRNQMIESLNVVADAVKSCMGAFTELTRVILKDAQYLETLVDHFPSDLTDIIIFERK